MSLHRAERIESMSDARVDDYRDVRDADLIGRRGVFMVEGEVTVRVMARRGRFKPRSVLLSEARVEALSDVIEQLPPEVPVYVASQPVLDKVVGFAIHRGVLAACDRGEPLSIEQALTLDPAPGPSRVVVLEGLLNHDNVGGIFRNAAGLGARAVLIDAVTCDPHYRKAIRVSAGSTLFLPFARAATIDELATALRAQGYALWALTPASDALDLDGLLSGEPAPAKVALLLGSEGPGLSDRALSLADKRVSIRMHDGFDSLNVATTSGIALHALRYAQMRG